MTRTPSEMELRVAKAMYENARATYAKKAVPWEDAEPWTRDAIVSDARASIRALANVPESVLDAFHMASLREWNAAIDLISPPDEKESQ